jgi:hypothetical protein
VCASVGAEEAAEAGADRPIRTSLRSFCTDQKILNTAAAFGFRRHQRRFHVG